MILRTKIFSLNTNNHDTKKKLFEVSQSKKCFGERDFFINGIGPRGFAYELWYGTVDGAGMGDGNNEGADGWYGDNGAGNGEGCV